MQAIQNETLAEYLDVLSAKTSTPGGGAVAAITGAQAAALISMVCQFSDNDPELILIAGQAEKARITFLELADQDSAAFSLVMSAFKQPKDASNRKKNIQSALVRAAEPPRAMLNLASTLAEGIVKLLEKANKKLITDTGIAAILIEATVDSAEMNVLINLKSINDETYHQDVLSEITMCRQSVKDLKKVTEEIRESLKSG